MTEDPRLILLDPRDNVLVVRARIRAGDVLAVEDASVPAEKDVPLAHKLARRDIRAGEKILKYGAPVGVATADIPAGAHVHVHNVRSDYTPTYTLDSQKGDAA